LFAGRIGASWIEATLFDGLGCQGKPLGIPGLVTHTRGRRSAHPRIHFYLGDYGFDYKVRSVRVRWTGPAWQPPPPDPPVRARAPEAQAPRWEEANTDRPGADYHSFWTGYLSKCQQTCKQDLRCRAYTFVRPGKSGRRNEGRCWLKGVVPGAVASDCCVSGVNVASPAAQTMTGSATVLQTGTAAAQKTAVPTSDIVGHWKNDVGVVYEIVQAGDRFRWTTPFGETAEGTRSGESGEVLSFSWTGPFGSGWAKRIEWSNGASFTRDKP
jgi:hypothetical protein